MASLTEDLFERIARLEQEVEHELSQARHRWRYRVDAGRIRFEHDVRLLHKRIRQSIPEFIRESSPLNVLTAPIIYSMIVPLALLDVSFNIYQTIWFPIAGIPRVRRAAYVIIDRHHLGYLNAIEKFNCVYCGYANGVLAFAREIAGRTEQYWCPIRHATRVRGAHTHYRRFVDYGDAKGYHQRLSILRDDLQSRRDESSES